MPSPSLAAIPYTTFPVIEIGPLTLRTFGLMVAVGVVLAVWFGAVHGERYGIPREETYRMGTRVVIAGVVGSRLTWVLTHLSEIDSPLDVIAVWEGGLQFSGGFIAAVIVGLPTWLRWSRLQRWQLIDGYAVAVLIGAAFGRIGCYSVGEHFGRESGFFLASRYDGGEVREARLGLGSDAPFLERGMTFHNLALYEGLVLFVLVGVLWLVLRRRLTPGTVAGLFLVLYATSRFGFDALRVNDERVLGLTGAQWMCLAMVPIGIYVLTVVRSACATLITSGDPGGLPVGAESAALGPSTDPQAPSDLPASPDPAAEPGAGPDHRSSTPERSEAPLVVGTGSGDPPGPGPTPGRPPGPVPEPGPAPDPVPGRPDGPPPDSPPGPLPPPPPVS